MDDERRLAVQRRGCLVSKPFVLDYVLLSAHAGPLFLGRRLWSGQPQGQNCRRTTLGIGFTYEVVTRTNDNCQSVSFASRLGSICHETPEDSSSSCREAVGSSSRVGRHTNST